jgi:hypothetical protein
MAIHRLTMISMNLAQWQMKPANRISLQPTADRVHLTANRVAVEDVHVIETAVGVAVVAVMVETVIIDNR